ncbi:GTP pyrophosphokinase [Acaryochloris sp. 'Moss Beach']|uniref:GTP pyrophosphokinase n=1 Tax=Acaryochloris sp. 'Moss Beach' TaxID=2740837 RepID=UPI001F28A2FF|nr:GTP pyrophosphokinase [Acaryochloris sp. 'Moss Beach']UJB71433.1 GTP pyrophosphokinase [Acaryochloris sp. 'Moss Beach']
MASLIQSRSLEELLVTAIAMVSNRPVAIATQSHTNQFDKAGKPYIDHPLRVMGAGNILPEKIMGVLHDAVEDSELTLVALTEAGFPAEIVAAIDAITKRQDEPYDTYLGRVMTNSIALRVKIADMTDNMDISRIAQPTDQDWARLKKYETILPRLRLHGCSKSRD